MKHTKGALATATITPWYSRIQTRGSHSMHTLRRHYPLRPNKRPAKTDWRRQIGLMTSDEFERNVRTA